MGEAGPLALSALATSSSALVKLEVHFMFHLYILLTLITLCDTLTSLIIVATSSQPSLNLLSTLSHHTRSPSLPSNNPLPL